MCQQCLKASDSVRSFAQEIDRQIGKEAGFTLVEMLVVITIIGLIMALVGPRVLNYLGESKVKAAQIQIESSPARSISSISMPVDTHRQRKG